MLFRSPAPPAGDLDLNAVVDAADIDEFVAALQGTLHDGRALYAADADGNGVIDAADVDDFIAILQSGGVARVPEPTAVALLGLGGLLLWRRRRLTRSSARRRACARPRRCW